MTIVLTDHLDLIATAVDALDASGTPYRTMPDGLTGEEVAERVGDADVLIIGILPFPRAAIEKLSRVGLMIRCGIGVDVIDVTAATEHGVWVANIPDYCVAEVADHALLCILAAARQVRHFQGELGRGRWATLDYVPVHRLEGRTLGLIGLGRIGAAVATRAAGFGLRVIASDPLVPDARFAEAGARRVDLPELLASSDIISIHTPLTTDTRHLIGTEAIERMKHGVVIVNVSRGPIVDLNALDAALQSGRVGAVGLDVVEGEPSPDFAHPIFDRPNAFITPHVAWYSLDARREMGEKAAGEALRYLRGEPPVNAINPSARRLATPGRPRS